MITRQKLTDVSGLFLEISLGGSKLWRYRFRLGGKENTYTIVCCACGAQSGTRSCEV
ncbi:Arm DNA-binding domain-containing protein [Pseudomonas syringae]|uniref:Arm DNA-binding domain-containing protein n=1 Tax=Pseudomonas syringae TaxID=317 RepID=UPI002B1DA7F8|nr:Arm DNA-binding domain-containing protein [Pseudomonas syringae]